MLENIKSAMDRTIPHENKIISHIRDAIVLICYKIQREEEINVQ